MPGGYWFSPDSIASIAARLTTSGPSESGNPCPRLIESVATALADISAKIVVPNPCSRRLRYRFTTATVRGPREEHERDDREQHAPGQRDHIPPLVGCLVVREMTEVV